MLTFAAEVSLCENQPPVFDPTVSCYVARPDTESYQVDGPNRAGQTFSTCYVRERELLEVGVHATDPDGDPITISVLNASPSASFTDNGDGSASLFWEPEFIGPYSAAQSPFELYFVASDGSSSSQLQVLVNVINVNRAPELILPDSLQVAVDNRLIFQVRAIDLDLEGLTIAALDLPPDASFDPASGMFDWKPQLADTGLRAITFRATDLSGGSDSEEAQVRVLQPSTFDLNLGTEECFLGGTVTVPVNLANSEPIAGMELMIRFDPTVFLPEHVQTGNPDSRLGVSVLSRKDLGPLPVDQNSGDSRFPQPDQRGSALPRLRRHRLSQLQGHQRSESERSVGSA